MGVKLGCCPDSRCPNRRKTDARPDGREEIAMLKHYRIRESESKRNRCEARCNNGYVADAEAATHIAEIIKEGALEILHGRAGQGDECARELFYKLYEAVGVSVYDENEHIDLHARAQ